MGVVTQLLTFGLAVSLSTGSMGGPAPPLPSPVIEVKVDWTSPIITTNTAATVEVDVMPFLGEADWGGPYKAYHAALADLGAEYVRFSPWFANPRVVVTELTPHVCNASHPSTNWNSTYFDGVMADFQSAVCGPEAAQGTCKLSVVQQLSTMPEYMYVGGDATPLPAYPWNTTFPFDAYAAGGALVDKTCGQMARYFARLVGWYTAGGFHDECGHFHPSKFHYNWYGVSVLNENEHNILPSGGVAYTVCYDAIKIEVEKVNSKVLLVGPEVVADAPYMEYFLNADNHDDKKAPPIASWHWFGGYIGEGNGDAILQNWMQAVKDPNGIIRKTQSQIAASGQKTEVVLNEFIPFLSDWCNCTGNEHLCGGKALPGNNCPNYQLVATGGGEHDSTLMKGIGANRATWSWNAAAAVFALGYATLAELGYKYVGADQLVGGVWPDNEPAVSCLDWQTGEPNAKYYAITALTSSVGTSAPKTIFKSTTTTTPTSVLVNTTTAADPPVPASCHVDDATGPISYKFAAGNVFPTTPGHEHGRVPSATAAGCCAICQSLKNCSFWTFEHGGTAAQPTCYSTPGACCYLKTAAAASGRVPGQPGSVSGQAAPIVGQAPVYVMPYELAGKKGFLIINMVAMTQTIHLVGVTGGSASSVEVATTGDSAAEPGYAKPVQKTISSAGELVLGPFAVAVVDSMTLV